MHDFFDVNNSYVLHKLKTVMIPFIVKEEDWKRKTAGYDFSNQ